MKHDTPHHPSAMDAGRGESEEPGSPRAPATTKPAEHEGAVPEASSTSADASAGVPSAPPPAMEVFRESFSPTDRGRRADNPKKDGPTD
jgi:hypothetical protein